MLLIAITVVIHLVLLIAITVVMNPEFQPYVFQLLAQLLEAPLVVVTENYDALFPVLLAPALWESGGQFSQHVAHLL